MARQSPEQAKESRRLGGINSAAGRPRYPKGHPRAGQLMPKGADPAAIAPPAPDPVDAAPAPPADPPTPPAPQDPPAGGRRINPLTATPRDLFDRIRGAR